MIRHGRIVPYGQVALYDENEKPTKEIIGPKVKGSYLKRKEILEVLLRDDEFYGSQSALVLGFTEEELDDERRAQGYIG